MFKGKLIIFIGGIALILFILYATRNVCNSLSNPTFICQSTLSFDFLAPSHQDTGPHLVPAMDPNQ